MKFDGPTLRQRNADDDRRIQRLCRERRGDSEAAAAMTSE